MSYLSLLRKIRLFPVFGHDEIINAETEDVLREHEKAIERVTASTTQVVHSDGKLRNSIKEAKARTRTRTARDLT